MLPLNFFEAGGSGFPSIVVVVPGELGAPIAH
jgi:hypothetical protein